jgi:hypothetical protein
VGGEQLGDAAAVGGGADVQHPGALERRGGGPDVGDDVRPDDLGVVVELLLEKRYPLEHHGPI